jgi:hypothetical protein
VNKNALFVLKEFAKVREKMQQKCEKVCSEH